MAAYAALVSQMCNIEQMISHPHLSTCFDNNQIQPLLEKAAFLLDFIESHHIYCGGEASKEAQDLERRVASAAHAAEDVIESHIVDQIVSPDEQKKIANERKKMADEHRNKRNEEWKKKANEERIKKANDEGKKKANVLKMIQIWENRTTSAAHAAEAEDDLHASVTRLICNR